MYDETFFPRAPCPDGFVRLDHPALHESYRQELRLGDICVVDPCSVDPISGQRIPGTLAYFKNDSVELKFCHCPAILNLFGVYSEGLSMLGVSNPSRVVNACLQPFNVILPQLRHIEYKLFWGRTDNQLSDEDIVAYVSRRQLNARYDQVLYPVLERHPDHSDIIPFSMYIVKFSTSFTPREQGSNHFVNNIYGQYIVMERRINNPCFTPGEGRCITVNPNGCIRRHNNAAVGSAEFFGNDWCYFSREGDRLTIWSPPLRYPTGQFPVAFRCNMLFVLNVTNSEYTVMLMVFADKVTRNYTQLAQVLSTFSNYSIH